jgi:uncharacterized protein
VTASRVAQDYDVDRLTQFRAAREETLKADSGWLTIAGLHFLNQGANRIGSDPGNDIVLDFPSVPHHAGVITLNGTSVSIEAVPGQSLVINERRVTESALHGPFDGKPLDTIAFGPVSVFVHHSGPRLGLRVRDQQSVFRTSFRGLRWYPPSARHRVTGRCTPYAEVKTVQMPNVLGDLEPYAAVGTVSFTLDGVEHALEAWRSGERIWFVFRDLTSGHTTYPSGRFLYADAPTDGRMVLDFNYALNPPCAYNPYTTCPLPPPRNQLPVLVEAGEKNYPGGEDGSLASGPGTI